MNWKNLFKYEKSTSAITQTPSAISQEQKYIDQCFDEVVGMLDLKEYVARLMVGRQHAVFIGSPATAKSLFLYGIAKLPNAVFFDGSGTTKAGLNEYLIKHKPRWLCIDELDKMKKNDVATLHLLLETGEIIYQQINRQVRDKLDITVYATCNNWGKFEKSIKSRFEEIFMKDYSYEEFRAIALHILPQIPEKTVGCIVDAVWNSGNRDIRAVRRLGKILRPSDDAKIIQRLILTRERYSKG